MHRPAVAQALEVVAKGVHQRGVLREQQRESKKQAQPRSEKHGHESTMQEWNALVEPE